MHSTIRDRLGLARRLGTALALIVSAAAASAQQAQPRTSCPPATEAQDGSFAGGPLRSGDLLTINVFRSKELSGPYPINSEGNVVIPGLGTLHAAGLSPTQVEDRLKGLLECAGFVPDVSVQPQIRVSVMGEVRNPGLFPADPGISLLQLLTMAGGQTPRADMSKVEILREGRSYPVNLKAALSGTATPSPSLQSGDVVLVPLRNGFTRDDLSFWLGSLGVLMTVVNTIVIIQNTRR